MAKQEVIKYDLTTHNLTSINYYTKKAAPEIRNGLILLITIVAYPIATLLNSVTVNPLDTLSRYLATVTELSFTNC